MTEDTRFDGAAIRRAQAEWQAKVEALPEFERGNKLADEWAVVWLSQKCEILLKPDVLAALRAQLSGDFTPDISPVARLRIRQSLKDADLLDRGWSDAQLEAHWVNGFLTTERLYYDHRAWLLTMGREDPEPEPFWLAVLARTRRLPPMGER